MSEYDEPDAIDEAWIADHVMEVLRLPDDEKPLRLAELLRSAMLRGSERE